MPTVFVSANQIYADIPANLILGEGPRQIAVVTSDPKLYSNQFLLNVQAPPKPQFQYYGIVARKRYNNDTAYVKEQGKPDVTAARLNDVIEGRFKFVSISQNELIVEDTALGFRHKVALVSEAATTGTGTGRGTGGGSTYVPYVQPNIPNPIEYKSAEYSRYSKQYSALQPDSTPPRPDQKTDTGDDSDVDNGDGNE